MKESVYVDYFFDTSAQEVSDKYLVLIIYDIVSNTKRLKFSKFLEKYGIRVQKSCFEGLLPNNKLEEIKRKIPTYIDKECDTVKIYKINGSGQVFCFGTATFTESEETIIV